MAGGDSRSRPDTRGYVGRFYAYHLLAVLAQGIYFPIQILFLVDRGFDMAAIFFFAAMMNVSMLALEIPTGIVADKISRKWSVSAGLVFQGLWALIAVASTSYFLMLAGFISFGLGKTLRSGADSALLYDAMKSEGTESEFQRVIGNSFALTSVGNVAGNILCGVIVSFAGLAVPIWAGLALFLVAATLPASMKEPAMLDEARSRDRAVGFRAQASSYFRHMIESLRFIRAVSALSFLVFIYLVVFRLCTQPQAYFAQPYLDSHALGSEQISYFYAGLSAISALFAKYSARIKAYLGGTERRTLFSIVLVGVVALVALANAPSAFIGMLAFVGFNIAHGLFVPFIQDSLNRRIPSEMRASCLSVASAGQAVLGIIVSPLLGSVIDAYSLRTGLFVFQWTFLGLLFVGLLWGWRALASATDRRTPP